jgi:hypothetical protein
MDTHVCYQPFVQPLCHCKYSPTLRPLRPTPSSSSSLNPSPSLAPLCLKTPRQVNKGSDVCRAREVTKGAVDVTKNEEVTYAISLVATAQERYTAAGNVSVESSGVGVRLFALTSAGCTFSDCQVSGGEPVVAPLVYFWGLLDLLRGSCVCTSFILSHAKTPSHQPGRPAAIYLNPLPLAHPRPPTPHARTQPAAAPTDLASGQKLTCAFACEWTTKPASATVPISAAWALTGAAAATATEQGPIPVAGAVLQVSDACVYAHDVPNSAKPQLMSPTPYCFAAAGPNQQIFSLPRYTVTMGKDKCAGRYLSGTPLTRAASARRARKAALAAGGADGATAAAGAADPAAPAEGGGGGGRRLQTFCLHTKPKVTAAKYTNQLFVSRDVNGTDEVSRSNTVVVTLTNCPGGCAGSNVHTYGSVCCVCGPDEEYNTVWGDCVKCRAGWVYDSATNKCASTCKDPAAPFYTGGKCQACPAGADGRVQEYVPATGACRACKIGFEVSNATHACESLCYGRNGPAAPVYVKPTTVGAAYSCAACPVTKPIYAVDLGECVAPCPAAKPERIPGTHTCVTAAQLAKRNARAAGARLAAQQPSDGS